MVDSGKDDYTFSVVIPTYNEEDTIGGLLDSIMTAAFPVEEIEVIIVDGMSEDGTRDIVREYSENCKSIELYDNPDRHTPEGINVGFEVSTGETLVLVGGHSTLPADFFTRIQEGFTAAPDAGVVGGVMQPTASTYFGTAVATALVTSVGSSSERFREYEGYVDTVSFGAYKREVIDEVGLMDTSLPRAQDYEYNRRARNLGIKIYQYPEISVEYQPRSTPLSLARQYFGYGYWKSAVFKDYGDYPLDPPIVAGIIAAGAVMATLVTPLLLFSIVYLGILVYAVFTEMNRIPSAKVAHIPAAVFALVIMQLSYLSGLFVGSFSSQDP